MRKPLVRLLRLNGLQYNANRDPQAYRRAVGEAFRVQALLDGEGDARCTVSDEGGRALAERSVARPGTFTAELNFERPGTRLVTVRIEGGGETYVRTLRLDVLEPAPRH
jgi:hypothetical protein